MTIRGQREVYTTEELYEQLRPRLATSDAWMSTNHPRLWAAADAMVESLQKKECYGGGVTQRAAHLAAHLKATDPFLAKWLEERAALDADGGNAGSAEGAGGSGTGAGAAAASSGAGGDAPATGAQGAGAAGDGKPNSSSSGAPAAPGDGADAPQDRADGTADASTSSPSGAANGKKGGNGSGSGKGKGANDKGSAAVKRSNKKGGAATALEYLTTTFAHLREQRTLVMGDKKDRLLREVAALRQLRGGPINVLRGATAGGTTMGQMLAALKLADQDDGSGSSSSSGRGGSGSSGSSGQQEGLASAGAHNQEQQQQQQQDGIVMTEGAEPDAPMGVVKVEAADAAAAAPGVVGKMPAQSGQEGPTNKVKEGAAGAGAGAGGAKKGASEGKGGGGKKGAGGDGHHLDNLTCVVWEDWRIPERLDTMLAAGDSLVVYVEVHCRDGPEDTRLAMSLSTFVALALCSQRLIAELYQDMVITPQRSAAARPQRQRQRTAAEAAAAALGPLDESVHSLDYVDFVEALHRRMPLRCGWMYANAIMPTAAEWDRVFGPQAGRLSGLYDGGAELDALGRACMAFHTSRHESPVLDVHALAAHLRVTQAAARQRQAAAAHHHHHDHEHEHGDGDGVGGAAVGCDPCLEARGLSGGGAGSGSAARDAGANGASSKPFGVVSAELGPRPPSLLLRPPGDSGFVPGTIHPAEVGKENADVGCCRSGGKLGGYDLGHLSFTCVTTASLADDFLGEVIRQTTAGHAAAEVAAAAAAAATVRAAKCAGQGKGECSCEADVAVAQAAAAAAAAAAERLSPGVEDAPVPAGASGPSLPGIGHAHGADEDELFEAVTEELNAVAEAAILAERDAEAAADAAEAAAAAAAAAGGDPAAAAAAHRAAMASASSDASNLQQSLKGAFAHRIQLMPGVFYSYFIGSQAFTNTAWHVEDFLLQSINLMVVGRPKAWWWVPRAAEADFKQLLEDYWELEDVYTKCVPLASETVDKLVKMGCRRTVQLPGAVFLTSPGFAFHTTMSSGWSMADSSNFMANILGKDMHVLENERPLEQYPPAEGRTNTGEWVRFTMRRIEALRARNDPAYQPRPMNRLRTEEVARRQRAADKAREEAEAAEEEAREAARAARRAAKEAARQAKLKREAEEGEAAGGAVGPVSPSGGGGKDGKAPAGAKAPAAVKKEPGTGAGRDGRNSDNQQQQPAKKVKLEGDAAGKAGGGKQQPGAGVGSGSTAKKAGSGKDGAAASPSGGGSGSRKRANSAVNGGGNKIGRTGSGSSLQSQSSQQLLTLLQTAGRPQARAQEAAPQVKAEQGHGTGGSGSGPQAPSVAVKEESGGKAAHGNGNGVQVVVKFQNPASAPGPVQGGGGGGSDGSDCYSHANGNGNNNGQGPHGVEQVVMLKKRSSDELGHMVGLSAPVSTVSAGGGGGAGAAAAKLLSLKRESSVDGGGVLGLGGQLAAAGGAGAYKRTSAEQALPSAARLVLNEQRLQLQELTALEREQQQRTAQLQQLQQLQAQRCQADDRFAQMQPLSPHAGRHQHDSNGYHSNQAGHHHASRMLDMHPLHEPATHHGHGHGHGHAHQHPPHPAAVAATAAAASGLPSNNLLSLHVQELQQQVQRAHVNRLGSGTCSGGGGGRLLDGLRVMSGTTAGSGGGHPQPQLSPLRSSLAASGGCGGPLGGGPLGGGHDEPQQLMPRRGSSTTSQGGGLGSCLSAPLGSDGLGSAGPLGAGCGGGPDGGGGGDYLDLLLQRRRLQMQRLQHDREQQLLGLGGGLSGAGREPGLARASQAIPGLLEGGTDVVMYAERLPVPLNQQHQHQQFPQQQLRLAGAGSPRGVGAGLGAAGLLSGSAAHRQQGGIAAEGMRLPFPA
ncbi:hypothetical protein HYH02_003636 [Chlamydomonas schloesseri]|uniref:JmjC domain-containing protein n=1 Tax=Chlamydomonas schloesseri TaxID=2026947 RepID=A0A835WSN3_9CHLO|nr:hypothetical protein HYH02_003636 [Chlamydomonas schloesseri]|eukprot:KAG2451860.1 hypothetical protein HYH02_003636 [Chlamydomonas schloesseri]